MKRIKVEPTLYTDTYNTGKQSFKSIRYYIVAISYFKTVKYTDYVNKVEKSVSKYKLKSVSRGRRCPFWPDRGPGRALIYLTNTSLVKLLSSAREK